MLRSLDAARRSRAAPVALNVEVRMSLALLLVDIQNDNCLFAKVVSSSGLRAEL